VSKVQRAKSPASSGGDLTNAQEAPVVVPVAAPVAEVEVAPGTVPGEAHDEAIAAHLRGRPETSDRILALLIGIRCTKGETMNVSRGLEAILLHCRHCVIGRDVAVEVEELGAEGFVAAVCDREPVSSDVGVGPFVVASCNHVYERHVVVDGDNAVVNGEGVGHWLAPVAQVAGDVSWATASNGAFRVCQN
jgi:hypothetical protein